MAILYISLIINLAFVFNWFFILFLGLQQCSIPHSDLQLFYCLTCTTDIWNVYSSTYLNSLFMVTVNLFSKSQEMFGQLDFKLYVLFMIKYASCVVQVNK
jgi:hypothetical protein